MRKSTLLVREPLAIPLREAKAPLVLAIDIGTSGLRSFLFDVRGRPVANAIAHRDRAPRFGTDGEVSVDADERVRATDPAAYARTVRWLSQGEYLYLRLFGDPRASHGMASATGLYDQRRREWDQPLLGHLSLPESALSPISDEPQRGLQPRFARRW